MHTSVQKKKVRSKCVEYEKEFNKNFWRLCTPSLYETGMMTCFIVSFRKLKKKPWCDCGPFPIKPPLPKSERCLCLKSTECTQCIVAHRAFKVLMLFDGVHLSGHKNAMNVGYINIKLKQNKNTNKPFKLSNYRPNCSSESRSQWVQSTG